MEDMFKIRGQDHNLQQTVWALRYGEILELFDFSQSLDIVWQR